MQAAKVGLLKILSKMGISLMTRYICWKSLGSSWVGIRFVSVFSASVHDKARSKTSAYY